jgi:hypothetical protein
MNADIAIAQCRHVFANMKATEFVGHAVLSGKRQRYLLKIKNLVALTAARDVIFVVNVLSNKK